MDLTQPHSLAQNDLGGTPFGMIELKRQLGKVELLPRGQVINNDDVATELVWSDHARRQTGYESAVLLKNGRVVLAGKLTKKQMAALGGPLPQHDPGMTSETKARLQGEHLDALREADKVVAFTAVDTIRNVFAG